MGRGVNASAHVRRCKASIQQNAMMPKPSTNPSIASNTSEISFTGFTILIYARPLRVQIKSAWEGCCVGDPDYWDGDTPSLPASQSRYFLFPALNGNAINSGVS